MKLSKNLVSSNQNQALLISRFSAVLNHFDINQLEMGIPFFEIFDYIR